ncbi:MAG: CAP domain-containing protein [Synergistaceae bacterium]|nr:CAP domain-containing protein [Synergistaceae bacterium]
MLGKRFAVIAFAVAVLFTPSELCASDIYDYEPSFSPYYAGAVKSAVLYDALDELNYIRWLIGVPNNVTLNAEYTRKAQHGAVLLDALNTLTHTPGRPSDMDTSFYELGYDATTHGNLAVAQMHQGSQVYGNMSLSYSTKMYMNDSDSSNISAVGHRRWLMNPRLKQTGFGISTRRGYAVTYVIEEFSHSDEGNTLTQEEYARYLEWRKWPISDEYITWPTNKHPHPLTYFEGNTAWSVTLNSNVYDECNASAVRVRLTRLADNATWNFGASENGGYFTVADSGVAYDECVIFRPNGVSAYNDGEMWRVEVSGLRRKDGGMGNISYTVQFTSSLTGHEEQDNTQNTPVNRQEIHHYYHDDRDKEYWCNSLSGTFPALMLLLIFGIPRRK